MTISISTPTSNTGSIQNNSADVLTISSDNNVSVVNNLSSTSLSVNTDTLYVSENNRVSIGTSTPNASSRLHVYGTSGDTRIRLEDTTGFTSLDMVCADGSLNVINFGDTSDINVGRIDYDHSLNEMTFKTNDSERLIIKSNGEIYMATTDAVHNNNCTLHVELNASAGSVMATQRNLTTGARHLTFYNPNGEVGSIQTTGTTTSYVETSDYRLKENVAPMSGSIDKLKQLKPSTWLWKIDGSYGEGFLAHEAQAVVPIAVTGTKDEVDDKGNPEYQGIDKSKLVPLLTAALQEAITKIEDLEARIQTLENN